VHPPVKLPRFNPATVTAVLALCCVWLITHRYEGIRHDAWLYAGQALARLDPPAFGHDLFFAYGSQDDYSLFSRPYSLFAQALGIGPAALLLLIAAHLAWAFAAFALARCWLSGAALWIGLALIYALPRDYGADKVFHYAESFLTARSVAEPLVLAALAAVLSGRRGLAWMAAMLAFLLHPIIAFPGMLFLAAFQFRPGARMLAVLALAAGSISLALPAMDAEWLAIVRRGAPYVTLDEWRWAKLVEPLAWLGILATGLTGPPRMQQGCRALMIVAGASCLLALLATVTHAELLIQAQTWRGAWLLKVTALLILVGLFAQRWQRSAADRWLLAGLGAAAVTAGTFGGPVAAGLALLNHFGWKGGQPPAVPRWLPVAGGVALLGALAPTLLELLQQVGYAAERIQLWMLAPPGVMLGNFSGLLLGPLALLLPAGVWLILRLGSRHPITALLFTLALLAGSISDRNYNDDRHSATQFSAHPPQPFEGLIPRDATVYWQNHAEFSWFLLRRANYASVLQGVGSLFSRPMAIESRRRLQRLADFGSADAQLGLVSDTPIVIKPPTKGGLSELCQDPLLDFVILDTRFEGSAPPVWEYDQHPWFLYRCADFRLRPAAEFSPLPSRSLPSRSEPPHRLRPAPATAPV
jgi:hypothetical protein